MMFIRVGTLVVTVLYFPAYTIRTMAYGQFVVSSILVALYWFYFYQEFQKKAVLVKDRELHKDDPLLVLPFDSLRDFLPKKLEGQVGVTVRNFSTELCDHSVFVFDRPSSDTNLPLSRGDFSNKYNNAHGSINKIT